MNELITNSSTSNFYNHFTSLLRNCDSFILNVAFINFSGLQLILDSLSYCEKKDIKGKVLTSTYLNFTEVKALERLNDFSNIDLKIFDSSKNNIGFHSKTYIFEFENEYKILLGSSNITASAFKTNIEWNIKSVSKKNDLFLQDILKEFNSLWEKSFFVDKDFLDSYKSFQNSKDIKQFQYKKEFSINTMQKSALDKLEFLRNKGEKKALVIAATGTGKTYLSAFDIKTYKPKRVLFIVHRENILLKAKETFESIIEEFTCGLYTGNKKEKYKDYIFATIQTLSSNYDEFRKDEFDYIIVDEAHHITSPSYKKVCQYFNPKFLLGLTATPTRSDNESIYEIFDDNIACDIRLNEALEYNLVSPFHYYGISDISSLDYEGIDLTKISELEKLLMVNRRVDYILDQMKFYGHSGRKRKVLGFCASKEHALYMNDEFNKRGINSISLLSDDSIVKREEQIAKLEDEENSLEVIFTVDIFNEGVDIPSVNTILLLRPTNSPIIFIQQLGRGLRKYENKEFLTLLDFIGNHKKAYLIALALVGNKAIDKESIKISLLNNFANIDNAFIQMDKISKERILEQINNENFNSLKYLKEQYFEFKLNIGNKIPKLCDFISYDEVISPLSFISESKSYIEFLSKVEKTEELKILSEDKNFIKAIRFTEGLLPIKRVYEFVVLKYLLDNRSCSLTLVKSLLNKYLNRVCEDTIKHCFEYLSQKYFDSGQISRYLKLVYLEDEKLIKTKEFEQVLSNKKYKEIFEDSINYGIITYEKKFGIEDLKLPFFKLYEKYNMLNIAQLCNFNKIHSSFRGSGFLKFKDDFFLFITLEKDKFSKGAQYQNTFLSRELFTYSSKPSHSCEKGDGQKLTDNKKYEVKLHIFVRKFSHVDKKVQGFLYLGLANTYSYKNNKPINLELKLENPLDDKLYEEFTRII